MLHIIYNPIAGKGRSARFREAVENRLAETNAEYAFHETRGRRDAVKIARALTRGASDYVDIVAMGGDGTLHEVLNGIDDPGRVRLGIIPCGSGNDFAAAAGIPQTAEGALDVLLSGEAKYTDYMECSGVRGINAIGTGIDVDILRRYNRMKVLKGAAAYLASLVMSVLTYKPPCFSELSGGESVPHNAFIACAGNGRRIGGGIPICPEAVIDDGMLDLVIIDNIRRAAIPRAFVKLLKGRILSLPETNFKRQDQVTIRSDGPMPIQIDGEIYETLPFDVHLVTNKLRIYRP